MPEIRSGCTGSDARTDRWVPRVSDLGILGAGCERGRALAGGAHELVTRATGGGKRRGPDRRGHRKVGPTGQRRRAGRGAGADPRTSTDGRVPSVSGTEEGRGEKSARETARGPRCRGPHLPRRETEYRSLAVANGGTEREARAWTSVVGRRPWHDDEASPSTLTGELCKNGEKIGIEEKKGRR